MKGLILKDFINLRRGMKTLVVICLAYFLMAYVLNGNSFLLGMVPMLFMFQVISTFSYDDFTHWDRYALSLPVSKKDIVLSKYILSLILTGAGFVIAFALTMLLNILSPVTDVKELLISSFTVCIICFLYTSVILPIVFKTGAEKTRNIMILIFVVPFVAGIALLKLGVPLPSESTLILLLKLSPLFALVVFVASYFISLKIFTAKEV